jgi:hypothetical protein
MSDENEIEFEGGFFEEAGINANEVPDDPFEFGQDFWPVYVSEATVPKLTANGDKIGFMVRFVVDHPQFEGKGVAGENGLGRHWYRLPVPLALRDRVPYDPNGDSERKALINLKDLYKALGFGADEFAKVNNKNIVGRRMLTKIKAQKNENGYWEFRLNNMKPAGEGEGGNEFHANTTSNPGQSAEELAAAELAKELGS